MATKKTTTKAKPKARPAPPAPAKSAALARAQLEALQREAARRSLLPFVQRFNPKYDAGWVHKDICRRLERFSRQVAEGKSPRLMLLMPPRHGKSELASRNFPAWHLGQHPDHEFIACSYNLSLAMGFSRKVKQIIDDPLYQTVFDTRLDPNNQGTEEWALQGHRGAYVAAGIGGPITGKGAHCLVIDDPVKNAEEADSPDMREKVWEWYLSTAYSRLAPGGGVLVIQCMTGDTPVLRPDGSETRLDALRPGDSVATYEDGRLSASTVRAHRSNGRDSILRLTTSDGRMVRANGRHPFLTVVEGELKWIRARSLTTAHTIVALKSRGANGAESAALLKAATSRPSVEDCARATTTKRSGLTGIGRLLRTLAHALRPRSSTATELRSTSTSECFETRAGDARSAERILETSEPPATGQASCASTTAMTLVESARCSATTATQPSDIFAVSALHSRRPNFSDFTLVRVASVEPAGEEEVFDIQVERTENFIANGLVTHNTWWHDDDLAGRLQALMAHAAPEDADFIDQFEVIKYPAIAEANEYLNIATDAIEYDVPVFDPATHRPLRRKGEALHPARYDLAKLLRIKAQNKGGRWWSALYQQNPVPDDGGYFERSQFRPSPAIPRKHESYVYIAFDFAISEKKVNDYTVGTVVLQDVDDMLHVVDQVRFKSGDAFHIVEAILNLATKWHNPTLTLGFEDGQIYRSIESLLKKRMRERSFFPSITVLKPITDKLARAKALQGRMQQGMVSFDVKAPWYESMKMEMLRFPAGVHDDQVDSLAWTVQLVLGRQPPAKPKQPHLKSWKDRLLGGDRSHLSHMAA